MTGDDEIAAAKRDWVYDNPYLLLALAALFWSGNHLVGRAIGGEVPPVGISTVRWLLPTIALGLFAFPLIRRDWPIIRTHWGILLLARHRRRSPLHRRTVYWPAIHDSAQRLSA